MQKNQEKSQKLTTIPCNVLTSQNSETINRYAINTHYCTVENTIIQDRDTISTEISSSNLTKWMENKV